MTYASIWVIFMKEITKNYSEILKNIYLNLPHVLFLDIIMLIMIISF